MKGKKNRVISFDNTHYQPIIKNNKAWEKIKKLDFNISNDWVDGGERDCFDRIDVLAKDIKKNGSVLDIGCNIGFFSHILQYLGNRVTGIDNDVHVEVKQFTKKSSIQTAKQLNDEYGLGVEFIEADFIDYLRNTDRKWDYVLFLSVFHHFFIGYGYSDQEKMSSVEAVSILQLIDRHTEKALYFEMDEKVGHSFGWGSTREVLENIKMFTTFDEVEVLSVSEDGWAEGRTLFRCTRSKKTNEMPKIIPLSAYSRRNAVGAIRGGSLFITKEANDWQADVHPYGVDVRRQDTIRKGTVLEILKNNPHENICRVLDYDDYWVELEYIDGKLLSSIAPYIENKDDYLSNGISIYEAVSIIDSLKSAVDHLHGLDVVHTDLISFNVMVDKNKKPKIIDIIGAVKATDKLKKLDSEVFWKRCAMEIIERVDYEFLDEISDLKMKELEWGNPKKVQVLNAAIKEKERLISEDTEKIIELRAQVYNLRDELHSLRNSRVVGKIIKLRDRIGRNIPRVKRIPRKVKSIIKPIIAEAMPDFIRVPIRKAIRYDYRAKQLKIETCANEKWSGGPLVSVVIPFYNLANTIDDTLQSLDSQTFRDFEAIIVNDGSNDQDSIDKLKEIKRRRISNLAIVNQANSGVAEARNNGIGRARGKYIICLDSDDMLFPTFIEKAVIELETDPEASIVTSYMETFGVKNEIFQHAKYDPLELLNNNMIITAACFKKEAWEISGGYKPKIGYEDWEFWINLTEHGFWVKQIAEPLFKYRIAMQSRYVEDKETHWDNLKSIRSLHTNYKATLRALIGRRKREHRIILPESAFINLGEKGQFGPVDSNKKNILIAMPWMTFGGAETLVLNFCREIKDMHNTYFITGLKSKNEWENKFKEISQYIYHLPNLFEDQGLYMEFVSNYIKTHNIDIFHIIHTDFVFGMLPEIKKRHPKLKVIITMFNDRVPHYFQPSIDLEKYVDVYTSDNLATAKHYEELLPVNKNVKVIPNGIDCVDNFNPTLYDRSEERAKLEISDDDLAVFFVGRLSEEKNPNVFIEVAKKIIDENKKQNVKFFVIGDGPMRSAIEEQIESIKGLGAKYLGYQTDIARFLSAADVFVLPSSIEGFPLSILEAMAMRLVVISSNVGAVPDVITDGVDGYVVDPGSVDQIHELILKLLGDRRLAEKIKLAARQKLENKYSNAILKKNYVELYKNILK